jgi:hypothetical protein
MRRGKGAQPSKNVLQKLAVESYAKSPQEEVEGFSLMEHTPTLKFYKGKDNTIVVGIRGTADAEDLKADAMIGLNKLEDSSRFKADLRTLEAFQKEHTGSEYDYFGVGHSLGGAILDLFLTKGMIKTGISYNPAIQPLDIVRTDIPNHRIYFVDDALYKTMGRFSHNPEVRNRKLWKDFALSKIPGVGTLNAHLLGRFEGGSIASSIYNAVTLKKRYDYPPKVRTILKADGNRVITRIDVVRTPVSSLLTGLLQGLSLGKFKDASKKEGFDKFFHLYLRVTLDHEKSLLIEKNEVINVQTKLNNTDEEEVMPVHMNHRIHLVDFLENARVVMGDDKFFMYDPFSTNCQNFVLNLLQASYYDTTYIRDFILQPTDKLIERLGTRFASVAKGITDIAHTADVVIHGLGERFNSEF